MCKPGPTFFFAIRVPELPAPSFEEMGRLDSTIRPVRPDGLHFTVQFLGRPSSDRMALMAEAGERVALRHRAFQLVVQGVGWFPSRERPTALWLGAAAGAVQLGELAQALEREAEGIGGVAARREFQAHCTLARVHGEITAAGRGKLERMAGKLPGMIPCPLTVTEIHLLESVAGGAGPSPYVTRQTFPLGS